MKPVTQEEPMGCGIACVAFICGVSYKTAKAYFAKPQNAGNGRGYWCRDLVKALKKAGKKYGLRHLKNNIKFAEGSIVFIKYPRPFGHYLVRYKNKWMTSWINSPTITPASSGFVKKLPSRAVYYIFPINMNVKKR